MMASVAASNYLVQFPINDWLTYGAFTYPVSFFVTELTTRFLGASVARFVVYIGFILGVTLSWILSTPQIAAASGAAFLVAQLLDISIFSRLRKQSWWMAPLFASFGASLVDTALFWTLAFWGTTGLPVLYWACGDFAVKVALDIALLLPFRMSVIPNETQKLVSGCVKAPAVERSQVAQY